MEILYRGNTKSIRIKKMNIKKILKITLLTFVLLVGITNIANADATDINLTIRSGDTVVFSNLVPLPPAGTIELNSHSLNADSVLSIMNSADLLSSDFSISDLQYYDSFGSFYLKCITSSAGNNCDDWQYTVDNVYPGIGMDQKILSGGENIYVYFGPQNKIILSSNNINTSQTLTVTTQKYKYQDNSWETRTGVIVGITQPDPSNPWSPIEILTSAVDTEGKTTFDSIPAGSYNVGVKEDSYFPTEALTITTAPSGSSIGGNGNTITNITTQETKIETQNPTKNTSETTDMGKEKIKFNLEEAFEFLISQQKENGSFGQDLYTDWVSIALASGKHQDQVIKLVKYFSELKMSGALLTDYERHSMALMALGLNPYNTNGENYIKKITDSFDGKQFGDIKEDNDDIFALIVLQNAGYTKDEDIIKNTIKFILSRQQENGSWDESVDLTGAAIESLSLFAEENINKALLKAKEFLKENQKETGGWNNVSSTAWVIEGILALSEKPEDWIINTNSPLDYLANNQDTDGGIKDEYLQNRIWQTAYTLSALSGKTWNQIMQKFEKPNELKGQSFKNSLRTALKVVSAPQKIETKKTTSELNKPEVKQKIEEQKPEEKGWFKNFLSKIFNIF